MIIIILVHAYSYRSYRSLVIPVSCFLFLFCRFEEELSTLQELWKLSEYVCLSYIT